VRTTLSADEGCDPAALEQGRIATRVALEWLAQRGETRKLAETIPPLAWRGGDFTSRVAVSKVQSVDQRMRLKCGVGFRQLRSAVAHVRGSYVAMVGRADASAGDWQRRSHSSAAAHRATAAISVISAAISATRCECAACAPK
jgi:hypothetical protein